MSFRMGFDIGLGVTKVLFLGNFSKKLTTKRVSHRSPDYHKGRLLLPLPIIQPAGTSMHLLKISRPNGIQLIALEGVYGDSGTWRQAKPVAPREARTLTGSHGTWEWKMHTRSDVSVRTRVVSTAYELVLYDTNSTPLSLGYFKEKRLPARQFRYAFNGELGKSALKEWGRIEYPISWLVWSYTPYVNYCAAWVGPVVKVGGTLTAGGLETGLGLLINVGTGEKAVVELQTSRYGAGLGGAFGVAVAVFIGFPSIASMKSHVESGWDFSVAFAEKWSSWAKAVSSAAWFDTMRTTLKPLANISSMSENSISTMNKVWDKTAKAGDFYKVVSGGSAKFADDNPSICMLDIPGLGKGLELAAYHSRTEVMSASRL